MAEHTHMLIPDVTYGFSGAYAIALTSAYLGKDPDMQKAIRITEDFIRKKNNGSVPEEIMPIISEAETILPDRLSHETSCFRH